MTHPEDRRRWPRLSLSEGYRASFRCQGQAFRDIDLTDLSAGGCCLRIPAKEADPIEKGAMLQALVLHHPSLPASPMEAEIKHALGKRPDRKEGYVLVGAEYVGLNPRLQQMLAEYVQQRLGLAEEEKNES